MVEGPVGKILVKLTIPMILSIVSMVAFNLIDTYFVGQLGSRQLAAMSFTFPIVYVITGISLGLGMGASAVVSLAIGEGDQNRVRRLTTDSLLLAVMVVGLFVTAGLLTMNTVFRLMGATQELLPLIKQYMKIWYPGMIFVVFPMVGNNAIRATGDTKTPSIIMLTAVCVNFVLDPLLIFGLGPFPRLELAGAAIATIIARTITFAVSLWVLYHREKMITLVIPRLRVVWESWKQILYVGIPSGITNIIIPLGLGVITRFVAAYGPEAVAAFGVVSRIETFALTVIMALRSVVAPFVGQNRGAGRHDRVYQGVKYSAQFSMGWGAMMLIILAFAAKPIAMLFNDNPGVISTIALYLWIVPVSYGLKGVFLLSGATLNVMNRPMHAAALAMMQVFVLYIPLALAGSMLFGLRGIFSATASANILTGIAAYLWLRKVLAVETEGIRVKPAQLP